jgi:hypothetical protein
LALAAKKLKTGIQIFCKERQVYLVLSKLQAMIVMGKDDG